MSSKKQFLRKGRCSVCRVEDQVIAFVGWVGTCGRCDPDLFMKVGEAQKDNWLQTGRVFLQNKQNNAN